MSTVVTPPMGLIRPSQLDTKYRLANHIQAVIEQQPLQARSCGFGEKDRRTIDPPVILRLYVEDRHSKQLSKVRAMDDRSMFVVQCNLYTQDGNAMRHLVYYPAHKQNSAINKESNSSGAYQNILSFEKLTPMRNFLGALVSNAYALTDADGEPGVFFIFQDLSVRTEGRFRLKFILMDLSAGLHASEPLTMSTQVLDQVFSEPFTVYSPKDFPGMTESSALSKAFAIQGIKLSIRNDKRIKRLSDSLYAPSSADAEEAARNARGDDKQQQVSNGRSLLL